MVKIIEDRDNRILNAAMDLAKADGYQWITRDAVAALAGVSPATVSNVFGTMRDLKRAVLREAIARGEHRIVAQGLGDQHPIVMEAPEDVRKAAAATLVA